LAEHQTTTHDWAATEFVQKHIQAAAEHIGSSFANFCSSWYSRSTLDSPLEVAFAIWWRAYLLTMGSDGELEQQVQVVVDGRRYRLDFVVNPPSDVAARARAVSISWPKLCVELDGHEFHERTKEQVAYRNQRDRDLQLDGWLVFHFSGSELHRDPMSCVRSVALHSRKAFGWDWEMTVIAAESAGNSVESVAG
jgi:hypothetical protein